MGNTPSATTHLSFGGDIDQDDDKLRTEIMFMGGGDPEDQKPKNYTKAELIKSSSSKVVDGEIELENELKNELEKQLTIPRGTDKIPILALDLHDTFDLLIPSSKNDFDQTYFEKFKEMKNNFALVVIVSYVGFVGRQNMTDQEGNILPSNRDSGRQTIQELINQGIIDAGIFVFIKPRPRKKLPLDAINKGIVCKIMADVFKRPILFADDSQLHIDTVVESVPAYLLKDTMLSINNNPELLFRWIEEYNTKIQSGEGLGSDLDSDSDQDSQWSDMNNIGEFIEDKNDDLEIADPWENKLFFN